VKQCPGCDYLVPVTWEECRRCGQALGAVAPVAAEPEPLAVAVGASPAAAPATPAAPAAPPSPGAPAPGRPVPAPPATAPPATAAGTAASAFSELLPRHGAAGGNGSDGTVGADGPAPAVLFAEEFFAPARGSRPIQVAAVTPRPARRGRRWPLAAAAGALAAGAIWWFGLREPSSSAEAARPASSYEVLSPIGFDGALPSLADARRIEGEVAIQRAALIVIAASAEQGSFAALTPAVLAALDPSSSWVDGATPSSAPSTVSVQPLGDDRAVVAVAAGPSACALARVSMDGPQQVTIETDQPCAAATAPLDAFSGGVGPGAAPPAGTPTLGGGLVPAIVDDLPTGEPLVP
jgi:hypothetical protein